MSTAATTIQSQLTKANDALLAALDGEVVVLDLPGGGQTRIEMSNVDVIHKLINDLERKLARVQRSDAGGYGMSIKTARFCRP